MAFIRCFDSEDLDLASRLASTRCDARHSRSCDVHRARLAKAVPRDPSWAKNVSPLTIPFAADTPIRPVFRIRVVLSLHRRRDDPCTSNG